MPRLLTKASFKLFVLCDSLGIHVLPRHYYTPVPDYGWLKANKHVWTPRASLIGFHWDLDEQLNWLAEISRPYYEEVSGLSFYNRTTKSAVGPGFGPIESQVLHCFVRAVAPARIVEIGSGVSTACMIYASDLNQKESRRRCHITCIEPHPKKAFRNVGNVVHLRQPCQTVPRSTFDGLDAGDLLFIDSSHSVKVGSDVIRIYLDILPSLKSGVFVHIHDIFLPYLYQRSVLSNYFAWQETSLLLALLINNAQFSVLACLSALHYDRSRQLRDLLPDYRPRPGFEGLDDPLAPEGHFPASLWLKT
jgi:predicted O-methyltransferase YrrM